VKLLEKLGYVLVPVALAVAPVGPCLPGRVSAAPRLGRGLDDVRVPAEHR
jgi:hypothetical protein